MDQFIKDYLKKSEKIELLIFGSWNQIQNLMLISEHMTSKNKLLMVVIVIINGMMIYEILILFIYELRQYIFLLPNQ